jgi:hypothetical protein
MRARWLEVRQMVDRYAMSIAEGRGREEHRRASLGKRI